MATVSLRELTNHLHDARKLVDAAINSDVAEPELDLEAIRESLRAALKLLGEDGTAGAADN
jgi:hypothetical protein